MKIYTIFDYMTVTVQDLFNTVRNCLLLSTGQVSEKNSDLLQEALEPHYIHEVGGNDRRRCRRQFVIATQWPPGRHCHSAGNR